MSEASYDRMSPEFALVQALGTVPVIAAPDGGEPKVAAMQPRPTWKPPFVFYIPTQDTEEEALDGETGLQRFTATVHFVAGTHRGMQLLCMRAKKALKNMRGAVYSTPVDDTEEGPKGSVLIEDVIVTQSSPDLIDLEVGFYRRLYTVQLDYQTESIGTEEEEVSAG